MEKADIIKKRRKELRLSLQEVANLMGVSRQTVSKYENGIINNIPHDSILRLASALQTTPARLMGWTESPVREEKPATRDIPEDLLSAIIGVSPEEIRHMDDNCLHQALADEIAKQEILSGIDPDSGKYVRQLPPEAMVLLNNHIRLLAQAYAGHRPTKE